MDLDLTLDGTVVRHDVRGSFGALLRDALSGSRVIAALGPIYRDDPGEELLRPFVRSADVSGWSVRGEEQLAPAGILTKVREARTRVVRQANITGTLDELNDWTRAGLVLEVARANGVHVSGRGVLSPVWNLNGTSTGRFGCEAVRGPGWTFNPLSLGPDDRRRVRPSASERHIATLDYRAMDVCSMISMVPGLASRLGDSPDPYQSVSDMTGRKMQRDEVKLNLLTWAYGGHVDPQTRQFFEQTLPELWETFRGMPHGEFPRMTQTVSAAAFRAGLSAVLPDLVGFHLIPMFTVHDELVLDSSEVGLDRLAGVAKAMGEASSQRIGVTYRVGVRTGYTYEEAKNG